MTNIEQDFLLELAQIQAESIGWISLDGFGYEREIDAFLVIYL